MLRSFTLMRSLTFKWTVTLLLTSLIGVILVGIFAYRTTVTQFDRLRSEQAEAIFMENVTHYYEENGTWDGLETWLKGEPDSVGPHDYFRSPDQFALVDADGVVVVDHGPFHKGDSLPEDILTEGTPISLDGETIGIVLTAMPPPELDPTEQRYVDGTTQALIIGALGAGSTALVIGLLLSRQFLRPLTELTAAITAMRAGNLDQKVNIRTQDELGLLAQAFNEMSANLHQANQLRKQMTADIAHDLRTPLTIISGYLEAMTDGTLKPTQERFKTMSEEVLLLQRLVEDLRTLSLADAGELKLMCAAVAPREILDRVAASFQEAASSAGVMLAVEADAALPSLWIDSERMVQVLGNLVANALRHTPSGSSITLMAQEKSEQVELRVQDTGAGIVPEDLPKIFDRFYRSDPSRQTESGESGLGLAIARSIVEAHRGTITAESTLGQGTTMIIRLPAYKA
ncbi:HAMP domain-containing protein [Phototrophicus methaneseepsis]|uniref:histidine kinase n=1 Tax=Phototrophicus methaneseepsis TaxID=2710758 RepID=A0A7S8EDG0_9CHLR|nr:ATP-binding protein [Phototrophicus methaneseepsis]QPC84939.1 HAMP domain-containing protein [Phototrophicus methaneseepsis]